MNIVDRYLEELGPREFHARYERGRFHITLQPRSAPPTYGEGTSVESAIRDTLENARMGVTTLRAPQPGEAIFEAQIHQEIDNGSSTSLKRFVAKDLEHAEDLAHATFGDRLGFQSLTVRFVDTVK